MLFKKIIAFTLSEVLLVLLIIGVTAAITLPTLNADLEDRKVVAQLRKEYAELQAVYEVIVQTYGKPNEWNSYTLTSFNDVTNQFGDYFAENAKILKDCGNVEGDNECFPEGLFGKNYRKFLMKDGSSVAMKLQFYKADVLDVASNECGRMGQIFIDVNGPRGENAIGEDTFIFNVCLTNGIVPFADKSAKCTNNPVPNPSKKNYVASWVLKAGNRDYLKCADDLDWNKKRTCD